MPDTGADPLFLSLHFPSIPVLQMKNLSLPSLPGSVWLWTAGSTAGLDRSFAKLPTWKTQDSMAGTPGFEVSVLSSLVTLATLCFLTQCLENDNYSIIFVPK